MGAHHPVDGGGASYSAVIADHQASVHGKMHSSHIAAQDWKKMRRSQCLTLSLLFLLPSSPRTTAADTQQPGWESRRRWQRDARAAAARLWWPRSQTVITVIPKPNHCQHCLWWLPNKTSLGCQTFDGDINIPLYPFLFACWEKLGELQVPSLKGTCVITGALCADTEGE